MAAYCSSTCSVIVAGDKGNRLEAVNCPMVVVIGQTEVGKMAECCCYIALVYFFWTVFRQGRGSSVADLSQDLFEVFIGVI